MHWCCTLNIVLYGPDDCRCFAGYQGLSKTPLWWINGVLFHLFSVQQANRKSCQQIPALPSKPVKFKDGVENFTVNMYINELRCECTSSSSACGSQLHLYTYLHMQCYNVSLLLTRSKFTWCLVHSIAYCLGLFELVQARQKSASNLWDVLYGWNLYH